MGSSQVESYEKGKMGFLRNPMNKGLPKVAIWLGHALLRQFRSEQPPIL